MVEKYLPPLIHKGRGGFLPNADELRVAEPDVAAEAYWVASLSVQRLDSADAPQRADEREAIHAAERLRR